MIKKEFGLILIIAIAITVFLASCGAASQSRERGWGCPNNPYFQR
ncbi:MAG: hypothetical protein ACRCR9_01840 [Chitinophagaceae bacterium]